MEDWKVILHNSISTADQLADQDYIFTQPDSIRDVCKKYPMRINQYYLNLIKEHGSPLLLQAVPDIKELKDHVCLDDPLAEERLSKTANLVHKYPDRVLFLVSSRCAMYCRYCTRKRMVGTKQMQITPETISRGIEYIQDTPAVREVLLSGGDPLLLEDEELDSILSRLHRIEHVEVIRIGTKVPCTLPMRITPKLVNILKKYHPLYINTHFNHPAELTDEARKACNLLADGGIPLGCQTVLLRNINDDAQTLKALFLGLLKMRVKPYYLFQCDLTRGTNHFRTSTRSGISIMRQLIGTISGMAIPTYALDAPHGKGKIPLTPQYIRNFGKELEFDNYLGELCLYPEELDY